MIITPDFSDNKNIRAWNSWLFDANTDILFIATNKKNTII